MICSLTQDQQDALFILVAGDLYDNIKTNTPFNLEAYTKEIYDFYLEDNGDPDAALDYVRLIPGIINTVKGLSSEKAKALRKLGLDSNQLDDLIEEFENEETGLQSVRNRVAPIDNPIEILNASQELAEKIQAQPEEKPQVIDNEKEIKAVEKFEQNAGFGKLVTTGSEIMGGSFSAQKKKEGSKWYKKINLLEAPYFSIQRAILKSVFAFQNKGKSDSSQIEYPGVGGLFLKTVSNKFLLKHHPDQIKKDQDRTSDKFLEGVSGIIVDKTGKPVQFDDQGNVVGKGIIAYYPLHLPKEGKEFTALRNIHQHLSQNPEENSITNVITGGSFGIATKNEPWERPTPLKSIAFAKFNDFKPALTGEEDIVTPSGKIIKKGSVVYFNVLENNTPIEITLPAIPEGLVDTISSLFVDDLIIDGKPITFAQRKELIEQYINTDPNTKTYAGVTFTKVPDVSTGPYFITVGNKTINIGPTTNRADIKQKIVDVLNQSGLTKFTTRKPLSDITKGGYSIVTDINKVTPDVVFHDVSGQYKPKEKGTLYIARKRTLHVKGSLINSDIKVPTITDGVVTLGTEKYNQFLLDNFETNSEVTGEGKLPQLNSNFTFAPAQGEINKVMTPVAKATTSAQKEYRGLQVINTTDIKNKQGGVGAAQYDAKTKSIKVNRPLLQDKFKEKAWTNMRTLIEDIDGKKIQSSAKALPTDHFKTYEEFEKFVIEHEYQHSIYSRQDFNKEFPGKNTEGDYETEINNKALASIGLPLPSSTITQQGPADTFKKGEVKASSILDMFKNRDDLKHKLANQKFANAKVLQEHLDAAEKWYGSHPLSTHFPYEIMMGIINTQQLGPVATWTNSGVILHHYYNAKGELRTDISGDFTDLYHEAWHAFTQTFLTQEQRVALYNEARKLKGTFVDYNGNTVEFSKADDDQLEEYMAEDFRSYMISGGKTNKTGSPVRNSLFKKILDFLKEFFGISSTQDVIANPDTMFPMLHTMYEHMRIGDLSTYTFDVKNRNNTIGVLNKGVLSRNKEEQRSELNYEDSLLLNETVDSIISSVIDELNRDTGRSTYTNKLFKQRKDIQGVYTIVKAKLENDVLPGLVQELSKATSQYDKGAVKRRIDVVQYAINNFGDINNLAANKDGKGLIAFHQMKSKFISEEERASFFDDINEIAQSEKGKAFDTGGNEKYEATPDINYLLRSLHSFKGAASQKNILGVQKMVDFAKVWNNITLTIGGTIDIGDMYAKLYNAAYHSDGNIKNGTMAQLLTKLIPLPETMTALPKDYNLIKMVDSEQALWGRFWQTFNKANIPLIQMNINVNRTKDGSEITSYGVEIGSASTHYKKIGRVWENFFKISDTNPYIGINENNVRYLKLDKIVQDFGISSYGKQVLNPEKTVDFFRAIGVNLSYNEAIEKAVNKGVGKGSKIYQRILNLSERGGVEITSLKYFFTASYDAADGVKELSPETTNWNNLQELEAKYSEASNSFMVTNAEGNTQFEYSLNNTLSIMVDAINNVESYDQLIALPYMKHLDRTINPFAAASIWLESIFDFDNGGVKRTKAASNELVELSLSNLSGVSLIDVTGDNGIASAKADEFTKLIMDFHMMVSGKRPELMRHADKGTSFSIYLSDLYVGGQAGKKLYIDTTSFISPKEDLSIVPGFDQGFNILLPYMQSEIDRINKMKDLANMTDLEYDFNYISRGGNFEIFKKVFSEKTKEKLLQNSTIPLADRLAADPVFASTVRAEFDKYFNNQVDSVSELMKEADFVDPSLIRSLGVEAHKKGIPTNKELTKKAATRSFVLNTWIHNLESMTILYGDVAQYNMVKEEFHKRNAGAGSTGKIFRTDQSSINYVNSKGKLWARKMSANNPNIQENLLTNDAALNTAVLADNIIPSKSNKNGELTDVVYQDLLRRNATRLNKLKGKELTAFQAELKSKAEIALKPYSELNEGDAQGWITFDSYRMLSLLESEWTSAQEAMYNDIIDGKDTSLESIMQFFPTRKFQYFGPLKTDHMPLTAFHKFSLFPLIPGVIEGRTLEVLHNKMMEENIDYALFKSGSKVSTITRNGEQNKFYSNKEDRTFDTNQTLTKNTIYLNFLKDQLDIAPKYKGTVTFPTQLRKLIENGMIEGGVPIDFESGLSLDERVEKWDSLSPEEKLKNLNYKLIKEYEDNIAKLTNKRKTELIKEAGITFDKKGNIIFNKDLQNFIIKELNRQDLGDHEIDFIKVGPNGKIAHDFSISLSAEKIEKLLNAVVVKRLIKQKVVGEGLIQVSTAGFENIIKKFDDDLPYYKLVDGKVRPMGVRISLHGEFLNLLHINHNDGSPIATLDRLNEMIKNEEWLNKEDHRKMISLAGARIPTQNHSTMESMQIHEFLDPKAGNIIVLPSEIVAKAGSDFDIDKLTVLMPVIKSNNDYRFWATEAGIAKAEELSKSNPEIDFSAENITTVLENRRVKDYEMTEEDELLLQVLKAHTTKKVTYAKGDNVEGLQNSILSNIMEFLALENNFASLIRPNEVDLVQPLSKSLEPLVSTLNNKVNIHEGGSYENVPGTSIFEIPYNLYKHTSNNIGKQTLGLGAVDNTFNSIFNRIGFHMKPSKGISSEEYAKLAAKPEESLTKGEQFLKNSYRRQTLLLNHNTLKGGISLSHVNDALSENNISDVISQLMNGWVDIAKDAWIFNIQGNKEIAPSLLFMIQAGVPLKQAVYLVSHPLVRQYVKEQKLAKSTFAGPLNKAPQNPNWFRSKARDQILQSSRFGFDLAAIELGSAKTAGMAYKEGVRLSEKEANFFSIEKNNDGIPTVESNLLDRITAHSKDNKEEYTDADRAVFLHFLEIEEMAKAVRDVKMRLNVDTNRSATLYEAQEKIDLISQLKLDGRIPEDIVEKVVTESPIGSFFVQDFQIKLWNDFFTLRNNPTLNTFIRGMVADQNYSHIVQSLGGAEKFVNTVRNEVVNFAFQNGIKNFDIDNITSYKGIAISSNIPAKNVNRLKIGAWVGIEKGKRVLYIDKTQLKTDFVRKSYTRDSNYFTVGTESYGVAKVNAAAFPYSKDYFNFVIEREVLRSMYPGKAGLDILKERTDVLDKITSYRENIAKKEGETQALFNARIDHMVYEETLRDMALDNTFNSWKIFNSENSTAKNLARIQETHKELFDNYSLISNLTIRDKGGKSSIALADSLLTADIVNTYHQNLIELSDPNKINIEGTYEEKRRVAEFFDRLSTYAFLQSGLNTVGALSLVRIVPQKRVTELLIPIAQEFTNKINPITLEKFGKKFRDIYTQSSSRIGFRDYEIVKYDLNSDRMGTSAEEKPIYANRLGTDNAGNLIYQPNKITGKVDHTLKLSEATAMAIDNPDTVFAFNDATDSKNDNTNNQEVFSSIADEYGNIMGIPTRKRFGEPVGKKTPDVTYYTDVPQKEAVKIQKQLSETKVDKYQYYGRAYNIKVVNGSPVEVIGLKKAASETNLKFIERSNKILLAYENNPNVDIQNGKSFRGTQKESIKSTPTEFYIDFANGNRIPTPFQLNNEQVTALLSMEDFYHNPKKYDGQITLLGYAGTGKTSIMSIFDKYLRKQGERPIYSSPTHRANAVTKLKNPSATVMTLHALFGLEGRIQLEDGDYSLDDLKFGEGKRKKQIGRGDVLIVDEASMVSSSLYEFIESNKDELNLKVIYMGDPAQLKPVKDKNISPVFDKGVQLQLTKVERTGDNPILEESTNLRNGKNFNYQTKMFGENGVTYLDTGGAVRRTLEENLKSEEFKKNKLHFRILSAKSREAEIVNKIAREVLFGEDVENQLNNGDILMGYNNFGVDYKTKEPYIINSGDYEVMSNIASEKTVKLKNNTITFSGFQVTLKNMLNPSDKTKSVFIVSNQEEDSKLEAFVDEVDRLNKAGAHAFSTGNRSAGASLFEEARNLESRITFMKSLTKNGRLKVKKTFDYGYAHTIHKSQGGTYNNVLILADTISAPFEQDVQQQLKYVAMSRASDKVYVRTTAPLKEPMIKDAASKVEESIITEEPVTSKDATEKNITSVSDVITTSGNTIDPTLKEKIDLTIDALKQQKEAGKQIAFPATGFGQYMIGKADIPGKKSDNSIIARASFLYLSERLYKEFGYVNPGYEDTIYDPENTNSKKGIDVIQDPAVQATDQEVMEALKFCFKGI